MDSYVKALHYFRDAYHMLYDDCPSMRSRSNWNLAAKTAYDAMERVAKAVELLTNVHVTKQHNVSLRREILKRVPLVAWRAADDPMKSVSLCVRKKQSPDAHVTVDKVVKGSLTRLAAASVQRLDDISLIQDGSTIRVLSGATDVLTIADTSAGVSLRGHWVQTAIDGTRLDLLNEYLAAVSKGRNTSAYYADLFTEQGASKICSEGEQLFGPVKRRVGHRTSGLTSASS